jgi:hypothetical protein
MSTELSLRTLAKVVRKLDAQVKEVRQQLRTKMYIAINVHDPVDVSTNRLTVNRQEALELIDKIRTLTTVRGTVRTLLGSVNETAGVNALVTEQRSLEAQYEQLKAATDVALASERLTQEQLDARIMAARTATAPHDIYGRVNVASADLTVSALTDEQIKALELEQRVLRKRIDQLQDRLERINTSVTRELPSSLAAALVAADVI